MSKTVLIKPVQTEKSLKRADLYVFKVDNKANKPQIKETVEKTYAVEVKEIKTLVRKGKIKTVGRKRLKKQLPTEKLAYLTLSKGKIEDFAKNN